MFRWLRNELLLALSVLLMSSAGSQSLHPSSGVEEPVTSQFDLIDPEFDVDSGRICWVDFDGNLWAAKVDRTTGMFIPADGKGILVDPQAQTTLDLFGITFNGPEWLPSSTGTHIAYTKFVEGSATSARTARLALAREVAADQWAIEIMSPELARSAPYTSQDAGDPRPRITYVDPLFRHFVREVDVPGSELRIPGTSTDPKSIRFVKGRNALVYTALVDGVLQVFTWNIGSAAPEQITFDGGQKDLETVPWMWEAPEFGGALVLMTIADRHQMRFYRQLPDGNRKLSWTLFAQRVWDPEATVWSPEPMTYQGASYVYTSLITKQGSFPSEIWITNIGNSAAARVTRLTPVDPLKGRTDPELFIADDGPYIYYSRFDSTRIPGSPFCLPCSEGVFRVKVNL
jgi:hypothetical protein